MNPCYIRPKIKQVILNGKKINQKNWSQIDGNLTMTTDFVEKNFKKKNNKIIVYYNIDKGE